MPTNTTWKKTFMDADTPSLDEKMLLLANEKVVAFEVNEQGDEGPVEIELKPGKRATLSAGSGICYAFTQPIGKKLAPRVMSSV